MKKNFIWIFISIIIIISTIVGFFIFKNYDNSYNNGTSATRLSTTRNNNNLTSKVTEKEISSFSTTIKDKEAGRLTNISLTCSTLNDTIIKKGETFSFNDIVGKPTTERGYQEASIIIDHKTERGIGGGNCQVSSTLYNAVLNIPNLTIVERHEHGKDVTYVPDGKDAAVSFGSLDFKFTNNTENDIKIQALSDNVTITIKLIQITNQ